MPAVHFINVSPGDCSVIQHASGRVSMIDICGGHTESTPRLSSLAEAVLGMSRGGNWRMADHPTNPLRYLDSLGIASVFRFILTHPDMDHMDGLSALLDEFPVANFWDSGLGRACPEFGGYGRFKKEDWDAYELVLSGKHPDVSCGTRIAGGRFQYANQGEDGNAGGDGLYILAPDKNLVSTAQDCEDYNDASYVLLYRSRGGRILFSGDAHDGTWEHVMKKYPKDIENVSVMIAPHHGRKSDRLYDFLDHIKPKFTLFGYAPSEHLAYGAWNYRELPFITSNQAGNVVLEIEEGHINVFVENTAFANNVTGNSLRKNGQGYGFLGTVWAEDEDKT